MDNATTQIAISVFVDRFLPRFLDRCATLTIPFNLTESDPESGTGLDVDEEGDDDE
jgi:hypothetical protein